MRGLCLAHTVFSVLSWSTMDSRWKACRLVDIFKKVETCKPCRLCRLLVLLLVSVHQSTQRCCCDIYKNSCDVPLSEHGAQIIHPLYIGRALLSASSCWPAVNKSSRHQTQQIAGRPWTTLASGALDVRYHQPLTHHMFVDPSLGVMMAGCLVPRFGGSRDISQPSTR